MSDAVDDQAEKKTWAEDNWKYDNFLASWGRRRLSEITRLEVRKLHASIGDKHGRYG